MRCNARCYLQCCTPPNAAVAPTGMSAMPTAAAVAAAAVTAKITAMDAVSQVQPDSRSSSPGVAAAAPGLSPAAPALSGPGLVVPRLGGAPEPVVFSGLSGDLVCLDNAF